jgi:hypothetical protein
LEPAEHRNSFSAPEKLGLPLMVAIIGGETADFAPLADEFYPGYAKAFTKIGQERG